MAAPADSPSPPEVGLKIGEHAPNFILKDQNSREVSLDALLKKGPIVLVFYRSADWCLMCKFELKNFQRFQKDFDAAGGQVVGISYDSVLVLKRFTDTQHISFPLLSDKGSNTIDHYQVRDPLVTDTRQQVAAHVCFVIDQQGIVRAKYQRVIYDEQPGMGILLKALSEARSQKHQS